eukprot:10832238-Prorocentrum_lima.AAC.1
MGSGKSCVCRVLQVALSPVASTMLCHRIVIVHVWAGCEDSSFEDELEEIKFNIVQWSASGQKTLLNLEIEAHPLIQ